MRSIYPNAPTIALGFTPFILGRSYCKPPFHLLFARNTSEKISAVLTSVKETLGESYLKELLQKKDEDKQTPFHLLFARNTSEKIKAVLTSVKETLGESYLKELLQKQDKDGRTPFHLLFIHNRGEHIQTVVAMVKKIVGKHSLKELLETTDKHQRIPICYLFRHNVGDRTTTVVQAIKKALEEGICGEDYLQELLLKRDEDGHPTFHDLFNHNTSAHEIAREMVEHILGEEALKRIQGNGNNVRSTLGKSGKIMGAIKANIGWGNHKQEQLSWQFCPSLT